ncbi:MAG: hypothetical protein ACNA75_06265 [Thiohalomonadaceae bacterium]
MSNPSIVVYGPQGCGKSLAGEYLRHKLECERLVDDWDGQAPLQSGTLALTSIEPPYKAQPGMAIPFRWVA